MCVFISPQQQITDSQQSKYGYDRECAKYGITGEQTAQLIHDQSDHISKGAHITDGGLVHLVLFISRLIAPIAAKQGAHRRLNSIKL